MSERARQLVETSPILCRQAWYVVVPVRLLRRSGTWYSMEGMRRWCWGSFDDGRCAVGCYPLHVRIVVVDVKGIYVITESVCLNETKWPTYWNILRPDLISDELLRGTSPARGRETRGTGCMTRSCGMGSAPVFCVGIQSHCSHWWYFACASHKGDPLQDRVDTSDVAYRLIHSCIGDH